MHDLLSACRRDLVQAHYASFGELMDYCRRSANSVGRLLLQLTGSASARNSALSDAVCCALQLINFLQDIASAYRNNHRIYLAPDEMRRSGVTERDIAESRNSCQPCSGSSCSGQPDCCAAAARWDSGSAVVSVSCYASSS